LPLFGIEIRENRKVKIAGTLQVWDGAAAAAAEEQQIDK